MGPISYQFTSLLFHINPPIPEIQLFFKIWPWKFKVRVMWEGKVQSHKVCSTFYWYTSFIQCLKLSQKSCRSSCLESKGMGYLCIYHHYSPWSTPFLSLNSHSPHDFFLPFIFSLCQLGIIFYLHAIPSVVLLQCHTSAAVTSILPLYHLSYTFRPSPSILHRPSVAPSLQPLAPSVLSSHHPLVASSLCPSGAQLKEIWL